MNPAVGGTLWLDPAQWPVDWSGFEATLAVVDGDRPDVDAAVTGGLPPFPVIGVGGVAPRLASTLDAIVDERAALAPIIRRVARAPRAAAIAIDLLRATARLDVEDALVAESLAFATLQGGGEFVGWLAGRTPAVHVDHVGNPVRLSRVGSTLSIRLDRAETHNAIDRTMRDALFEALTLAALDHGIERVVLTATGRAFSVGGDLSEFGTTRDPAEAHAIRRRTLPARALARCADIVHAHVQGACIGAGIELAAFAGRLSATQGAWFQLPELAMGLIPGAGGCVSIPRRIGRQRTALMILSGRRLDARTALDWGLIDAIVDHPPGDEGGADQT